jgi:small subunit ribosomal protein S6
LTTALDKHAVLYNEKKRKGLVGRKPEKIEA